MRRLWPFLTYLACGVLFALALISTFLAFLLTGGDSAFADESSWIYLPWLTAIVLTGSSMVVAGRRHPRVAIPWIAAAGLAFVVTYAVWM